ncbi:MAG: hypothetical protein ACRENP_22180 [Longimicrobiales bacterium]
MWLPTLMAALAPGLAMPAVCSKFAPEPTGFHGRGFEYVAEVFPPRSRQNTSDKPVAYLYRIAYPGSTWRVDAQLIWKTALANAQMPEAALVSMNGEFITLDDYYQNGPALALYDRTGRHIRSYQVEQLLGATHLAGIERSDCGWLWRTDARYYILSTPQPRLYIVLRSNVVLELSLRTDRLQPGTLARFPELRAIMAGQAPSEETDVWRLNLRFSSITDIMRR